MSESITYSRAAVDPSTGSRVFETVTETPVRRSVVASEDVARSILGSMRPGSQRYRLTVGNNESGNRLAANDIPLEFVTLDEDGERAYLRADRSLARNVDELAFIDTLPSQTIVVGEGEVPAVDVEVGIDVFGNLIAEPSSQDYVQGNGPYALPHGAVQEAAEIVATFSAPAPAVRASATRRPSPGYSSNATLASLHRERLERLGRTRTQGYSTAAPSEIPAEFSHRQPTFQGSGSTALSLDQERDLDASIENMIAFSETPLVYSVPIGSGRTVDIDIFELWKSPAPLGARPGTYTTRSTTGKNVTFSASQYSDMMSRLRGRLQSEFPTLPLPDESTLASRITGSATAVRPSAVFHPQLSRSAAASRGIALSPPVRTAVPSRTLGGGRRVSPVYASPPVRTAVGGGSRGITSVNQTAPEYVEVIEEVVEEDIPVRRLGGGTSRTRRVVIDEEEIPLRTSPQFAVPTAPAPRARSRIPTTAEEVASLERESGAFVTPLPRPASRSAAPRKRTRSVAGSLPARDRTTGKYGATSQVLSNAFFGSQVIATPEYATLQASRSPLLYSDGRSNVNLRQRYFRSQWNALPVEEQERWLERVREANIAKAAAQASAAPPSEESPVQVVRSNAKRPKTSTSVPAASAIAEPLRVFVSSTETGAPEYIAPQQESALDVLEDEAMNVLSEV